MKICSKCKVNQDNSHFSPKQSWCKNCKKNTEQERRIKKGLIERYKPIITSIHKECCTCKCIKLLSEFYPSTKGKLKLTSDCKDCTSIKGKSQSRRLLSKENTRRYRENNRETYLASHRLHQFKRRFKQNANSDGTVTKEFLRELYSRDECYYCKRYVDNKNRTLEHKNPLSKGGLHSIYNIEMCCKKCNSIKKDLNEQEFISKYDICKSHHRFKQLVK